MTALLALFGAAAVAFAVLMLLQRSLLSSALCLLAVLFQIAAMFFVLNAPLVALMQLLVYAGAVMVLLVVAVMASGTRLSGLWEGFSARRLWPLAVFGVLLLQFIAVSLLEPPASGSPGVSLDREAAALLFGPYRLMTEAIGVLVLLVSLSVLPDPKAEGPSES